jgi:hypothetical protein
MASEHPRTQFYNALAQVASASAFIKTEEIIIYDYEELPSTANVLLGFIHLVYLPILFRYFGLDSDAELIEKSGDLLFFEPRNSKKGFTLVTNIKAQDVLLSLKRKLGNSSTITGQAVILTLDAAYHLRELDEAIVRDNPSTPSIEASRNYQECYDCCNHALKLAFSGGGRYPSLMLETASVLAETLAYNDMRFARRWDAFENALTFPSLHYLQPLCDWCEIEMDFEGCDVDCWRCTYIFAELAVRLARIGVIAISGDDKERLPDLTLEPFPTPEHSLRNKTFYHERTSNVAHRVYTVFTGRIVAPFGPIDSWAKSEKWLALVREQGPYAAYTEATRLAASLFEAIVSAGVAYTIVTLPKLLVSIFDLLIELGADRDWIRAEILRMLMLDFSGVIIED